MSGGVVMWIVCKKCMKGNSRQTGTFGIVHYTLFIVFINIIFSWYLICMYLGKFKELNDIYIIVDSAWEIIVLKIE